MKGHLRFLEMGRILEKGGGWSRKGGVWPPPLPTAVYLSTNWPLFTRRQNSILNWILKPNPLKQKIKKVINCLDCLERALFVLFTFRSHQHCKKSVQKEKLQSRELNVCAWQTSFSALFLLNKIAVPKFINNPHSKQDLWPLDQRRSSSKE